MTDSAEETPFERVARAVARGRRPDPEAVALLAPDEVKEIEEKCAVILDQTLKPNIARHEG